MKEIRKIEEIIERTNQGEKIDLSEAKVSSRLYWAYRESKDLEREELSFNDIIWENEVKEITEQLREADYESFVISSNSSGLLETLWAFKEEGCKIGEMTQVKQGYTSINYREGKEEQVYKPGITIIL